MVSSCMRSIFYDNARQVTCNESRIVYTLPSTIKWEEISRVERALCEQPVRTCLMSRDGTIHLIFVVPSPQPSPIVPNRLLTRAVRGMIRECLTNLNEEQQQSILFLTMRVKGLQSTDGNLMTEGLSFKPNQNSVTIIARLGANRPIDVTTITKPFASYTTNGLFTTSVDAKRETNKGISAEGKLCSDEGLLPLVLYVDVPHDQLRSTAMDPKKRAHDAPSEVHPRKRGFMSLFGW